MSDYELRVLNPATDVTLYTEAYNWRDGKRHVLPDRMAFESFADPDALAIGLFNGELQAVYFLHEVEPRVFQCHLTSKKGTRVPLLLAGAAEVARQVLANGATEIHAWVTPRNRPLRSFLESLGFTVAYVSQFPCQDSEDVSKLTTTRNQRREFVKYVLKAESPVGFKRPQADIDPDWNHG